MQLLLFTAMQTHESSPSTANPNCTHATCRLYASEFPNKRAWIGSQHRAADPEIDAAVAAAADLGSSSSCCCIISLIYMVMRMELGAREFGNSRTVLQYNLLALGSNFACALSA